MRWVVLGLLLLAGSLACADTSCGGCVGQPVGPFPSQPRVYDGVQLRVTQSGFEFVQGNLPQILDTLLADGLQFDIPPTDTDLLGVTIHLCQNACPISLQILDSIVSLLSPDKVAIDGAIDADTTVTIDSVLGHCEFPVQLRDKPLAAQVQLLVDPVSYFMHFEVSGISVQIEESDYDIQCPMVYDWLLELLKGFITGILNSQIQSQLDTAIADLVAAQTCLACDFYASGCPAGSSCNGDGICEAAGNCLIKPLGLIGILDLGSLVASIVPGNDASLDLLITPGQAQQASQRPFVRANGLEVRVIGGSWSELDACLPAPDPADIPPTGIANPMQFGNLIPGQGDGYMVGVAVADMYLDHFAYQLWRSGFLCLDIDTYGMDLISSSTLAFILPSVGSLASGANLPVRLEMRPRGVPHMQVGAGSFLPDGSVDEPILYLFLPDLRLDFWMKLDGRWIRFLALAQDLQLDLALEFTPENTVLPIVGEDSIHVTGVRLEHFELLAESEDRIKEVVPSLIGIALPQLLGSLEAIAIPDLQGFALDIKAVQGDVPRAGTAYYDFMSIYADLGFAPPPPIETHAWLERRGAGWWLINPDPDQEIQYRIDGRLWSPFLRGAQIELRGRIDPGAHLLEVRARAQGEYRSLDPSPLQITFEQPKPLIDAEQSLVARPSGLAGGQARKLPLGDPQAEAADRSEPRVGCVTASGSGSRLVPLVVMILLGLSRRPRRVRNPDRQ
jgi:hypothetical protein